MLHGPVGEPGELVLYEEHSGRPVAAPAWGRDLRLLPLDFVGRTQLEEHLPDRPRHRDDVPGASRLALPGGGTLYRYERAASDGPRFGFLLVGRGGAPRPALERAGWGAGGAEDPFVPRVAVDPSGAALLVATRPGAGGDLLEVDLATGATHDRTAHVPPLEVSDAGLWLTDAWGFGVAPDGVYRFERAAGALADPVPFPSPAPAWFSGEATVSPLRRWAATTAGTGPAEQHVWVFAASGPALRASQDAGPVSGAGFLPESLHGPYLAVSDDGRLCAWRQEGVTRECLLARVASPAMQVTADAWFVDTLDEVGQMSFFDPTRLTMGVGCRDEVEGNIESFDLFHATLDAQNVPVLANRTLSSGDGEPPFEPGTITPETLTRMPDTGALLIHDEKGERLIGVQGAQATLLAADVKDLYVAEVSSDHVLLGVRRSFGSKPGQLLATTTALGTPALVDPGGDDVEYAAGVGDGSGTFVLLRGGVAPAALLRVDRGAGTLEAHADGSGGYWPPFGFSATGAALFAEGPPAGPTAFVVWPEHGGDLELQTPLGPGLFLP